MLVVTNPSLVQACRPLASVFGLPEGSPLVRFERSRVYRNRVFTTEVVHLPAVGGDPVPIEERARLLWFDHDITVDKAERIDPALASEEEYDTFQIRQQTPLFRSVRLIYGYRAKVLEHRVGHIHLGSNLRFMMGPPDERIAD